ncbi:ferredoxin [Actinomadura sp. WMMB 499]|uniref:ferredoxin n=1 Tax=Actinomadura sp. WMMB 499 TaxID=1219491 RepID=UPI0012455004|nr:ferredoxin [Actinomadura sp. WMMB 499]QFG24622.1 ferredoxin [Actinomadura sp. WMMB 499]
MDLYFDPVPLIDDVRDSFLGRWDDRTWLNVPGPFYGAETDNCCTGRLHAPELVLYEAEHFTEYVYRQPRTPEELRHLVAAADEEVFAGYGRDGDEHWTPAAVREWWRNRGRIREYLADHQHVWEEDDAKSGQGTAAAARNYAAYIDGELAAHLRVYLFFLEERRSPAPGDRLPLLQRS